MKFSYCYKTSDGVRREERIEAESREDAFAILRSRGIKAIKVVSLSGSKANGEERIIVRKRLVVAALMAGLLFGVGLTVYCLTHDFRDSRLIRLEKDAREILDRHDRIVATLHLEALRDYSEILRQRKFEILNEKISVGFHDLTMTRVEVRNLFSAHADLPGAREVYNKTMDAIDLTEARLSNDEKAFRLLDANRDKWTFEGGRIIWSDEKLGAEFANRSRELEPSQQ